METGVDAAAGMQLSATIMSDTQAQWSTRGLVRRVRLCCTRFVIPRGMYDGEGEQG